MARKITRAKWGEQDVPVEQLAADAVTSDLRTQNNTLSFWRCGSARSEEIGDAVLALAAGSERLDKVELVWLLEEDLRSDGLMLSETKGRTPVPSLAEQHVDVQELDYGGLGRVAQRILSALAEGCCQRTTKATVKKILVEAIADERLQREALEPKVANEVG